MSQSPQNHDDHDGLTFEVVEDEHHESGQKTRHRGIYLLPNLFTTAALFSGFYAIIHAMGGHYESAAMAIFVAALFGKAKNSALEKDVARKKRKLQQPFKH